VINTTDAKGRITRFVYDVDNQCRYQINPRGVVTEYQYNGDGQVIITIIYALPIDLLSGFSLEQVRGSLKPNPNQDHYQFCFFDGQGRLTARSDALGYCTYSLYDGNGNVVSTIRDVTPTSLEALKSGNLPAPTEGARTEYMLYDAANQLRFKWSDNTVTESRYDQGGRLISTTRYAKHIAHHSSKPIDMKLMQQLLEPCDQDRTTCYAYDNLGQLVKEVSSQGVAKSYQYDALGHVISRTAYATMFKLNNQYDISTLTFTTDVKDRINHYLYDTAGREIYRISGEGRVIERRMTQ
jgi:YD repeat-containing protein